ncbi:MAG: hypothetical protein GXY82_10750 [Methanospirillum sp.]|nr:hypothetical protein [Methanospirillum sp.]
MNKIRQGAPEPFDRAELSSEIADRMREKGEAELSHVVTYYRMAGLPAKKALEMAAQQAADVMVRCLTQGMVSATVEAMDAEGGRGAKTWTVGPAKPIRPPIPPWEYTVEFVVRANGFEIACPKLEFRLEPRLAILDAGLKRWPDGGYELTLGRAKFDCRVYLVRPPLEDLLIADPMTREFGFAEPISWGGSWTPPEASVPCPFGNPSACPLRKKADEVPPAASPPRS